MGESLVLDGRSLTFQDVVQVSREGKRIALSEEALERCRASRAVVWELTKSTKQIYGLNTGVGANKDNHITPEAYQAFNRRILYSHSIALPPFADREVVRATMLCRLNGFLCGVAGVQVEILQLLCDMLNHGIHPRIPQRGSVGMSDLGNMAYVGLAMIGEGTVEYKGQACPAREALAQCGLSPLVLGPKDGLPLVSSNAFSVAQAVLLWEESARILETADVVYAMGFEAQRYNPMFLDMRAERGRKLEGQHGSLSYVRSCLAGSDLWQQGSESLAGALSYKSSCAIHGAAREALAYVQKLLPQYLNATDDCPMVLTEEREIISTSHFIITSLALAFEMLDLALAHVARLSAHRIMRMGDERFSGLPRFLRPETQVIGYATVEKTVSALDGEIRHLANPTSLDYMPTGNDTEDHGCNTPQVMRKTKEILNLLWYLLGIEGMYAAQAADVSGRPFTGAGTKFAYDALRKEIPFLQEDNRELGADMERAHDLLRSTGILWERKLV